MEALNRKGIFFLNGSKNYEKEKGVMLFSSRSYAC
jgi:hypothetical protein